MKSMVVLGLLALASAAEARVDYAVDLTSPEHHMAQVSAMFPQAPAPFLDVQMPAWRTGRYQILNLANGVRGFSATDAQGRTLRWQKVDKSTWRIHLPRPSAVRISYELYGNELGLRSRHIDDSHAYLDASAVFMYADRYRRDDVTVSLKVPPAWDSMSGMPSAGANRFVAKDWDVLVDSPIETGIHKALHFNEGGRDYDVVFWGDGNYDPTRATADIRRIVAQAGTIWNGYPFRRYLFIVHATDGVGGATEHLNSTVIQIPRYSFQPRGRYLDFLSTTSHEFIHTWNVKSYRGAGLVPYDYQKENYSDLLWVAEGSTDYFSDHLLLRAGLMSAQEYLDRVAEQVDQHQHTPGTAVQSAAEASFDEWISVGGDRARNASAGIYAQGSIVSWMLDLALLQQSRGNVSYRDVHNALYQRFLSGRAAFTDHDVLDILKQLTGTPWDDWWARNVTSPGAVDFDRLLAPVGLKLIYPASDRPGGTAWAGWSGDPGDAGVRLTIVERGSPAWDAGFVPDDIIVAFDGKRVSKARFESAIAEYPPGATVTVTYFRRDQIGQKAMTLGASKGAPKIVAVDNPGAAQKALFERWLLIPYPKS